MKARFQIQSKGRQDPYLLMSFSEDVNLPRQIYVSGDVRTHGMIITAFKRQGSQPAEVRQSNGPYPRSVVLPWQFIGGYSDPSRIYPSNPLEIPIQPNDPVNAERWMIEPLMTQKKPQEAPAIRVNGPVVRQQTTAVAVAAVPTRQEETVPTFLKLKTAVRALNEVLGVLPVEPQITVEGRKVKITIPLD